MLKRGLATIYEAKTGVEFGGEELEHKYRDAEKQAKARGRGLWKDFWRHGGKEFESPREYKTRMSQEHPLEGQQTQKSRGTLSSLTSWLLPTGRNTDRK
jgi:hypothetical protein